jgi:hypothetical protein
MYGAQVGTICKHIVAPGILKHAQVSSISWIFVMRDFSSQHIVAPYADKNNFGSFVGA